MSDHRLQVDLDPGRSGSDLYDAGGTISGAIQLCSAESLDCRELTVTIGWQTEARPLPQMDSGNWVSFPSQPLATSRRSQPGVAGIRFQVRIAARPHKLQRRAL